MASVKCTVKVSSQQHSHISQQTQATVRARYQSKSGHVVCPISRQTIVETGESVDHSHIVPKNLRIHYPPGDLDGPDNIIPTFPALHKQIELHQHRPSLSFKFMREDSNDYDLYELLFSKALDEKHIVYRYILHKEPVRLHRSARPFLQIHLQVFQECEEMSDTGAEALVTLRNKLARIHVCTAITKGIVNASITRRNRVLKSTTRAGRSGHQMSAETILAWVESEYILVSGAMWEYEHEEERPDQVRCRVLIYNDRQKMVDLSCIDEYSCEDYEFFETHYDPKTRCMPKALSAFMVWKISAGTIGDFVIRVVSRKGVPDICIGAKTYNFIEPGGFRELQVVAYDIKRCLVELVSTVCPPDSDQVFKLTYQQVEKLFEGEIDPDALSRIRRRCFVVRPPDGGYCIARLLAVEGGCLTGCAKVHWFGIVGTGSSARARSWWNTKYAPAWQAPGGKIHALDVRMRQSAKWQACTSSIPVSYLRGMPFDLHQGSLPLSVTKELQAPGAHKDPTFWKDFTVAGHEDGEECVATPRSRIQSYEDTLELKRGLNLDASRPSGCGIGSKRKEPMDDSVTTSAYLSVARDLRSPTPPLPMLCRSPTPPLPWVCRSPTPSLPNSSEP